MTTTPPDPRSPADDDVRGGNRIRLAHLRVGLPSPAPDPPEYEQRLRELLAPFVAWLAAQELDEHWRRRHRDAAERFLRWSDADPGPPEDRRSRYEHHLRGHDPDHLAAARTGLDRWTEHRHILARTLPTGR